MTSWQRTREKMKREEMIICGLQDLLNDAGEDLTKTVMMRRDTNENEADMMMRILLFFIEEIDYPMKDIIISIKSYYALFNG